MPLSVEEAGEILEDLSKWDYHALIRIIKMMRFYVDDNQPLFYALKLFEIRNHRSVPTGKSNSTSNNSI